MDELQLIAMAHCWSVTAERFDMDGKEMAASTRPH
jgi:hypothetical protein